MAEHDEALPAAEHDAASLLALLWRDPRLNVFGSLLWLPLGWTIASWAPWLGQGSAGVDEVVNVLAPLVTFLLVAWNLFASIRLVHRSGHTLSALPLTLVQILLFTLLFYQFACHAGANQYTWERSPNALDWILFAVAHAARATDVIDGIEAYGLHIQSIRNVGHLASLSLVLYHFVVTVFFISLFVEWVNRFKRYLWAGERLRFGARATLIALTALLAASFLFSAFIWPGWRWADIASWPIDNLLRVLDCLDVFEIYQVRLHKLPLFAWESTLTFACRLLLAIALAGVVGKFTSALRLRWLAGFALDATELEELRDSHQNRAVRAAAEERLERLIDQKSSLAAEHARWKTWQVAAGGVAIVVLLLATPFLLPGGERPAEKLARLAIEETPWAAERALSALERMGSAGVDAVPILVERQTELPIERRLKVIATLGFLGPAASDPLEAFTEDEDEQIRLAAVSALRQVGPAAAPALIRGFGSIYPEVSAACVSSIRRHGNADAQRLADNLDANNVVEVVRLLDDVDPYWERRRSENKSFGKAADARRAGRAVAARGSLFLKLPEAIAELRDAGPLAAAEVAPLEPILFGDDATLSSAALDAFLAIDKNWHATATGKRAFTLAVKQLLTATDASSRRRAAQAIARFEGRKEELTSELQKSPKQTLDALRELVRDPTESVSQVAASGFVMLLASGEPSVRQDTALAIAALDGKARDTTFSLIAQAQPVATGELVTWCKGKNEPLRLIAVRALGEKGPDAGEAIGPLAELLVAEKQQAEVIAALGKIDPACHAAVAQALTDAELLPMFLQSSWDRLVLSADVKQLQFAVELAPFLPESRRSSMIPVLASQLRPENSPLQDALFRVLSQIDPSGDATVTSAGTNTAVGQSLLLFWLKHESAAAQQLGIKLATKLGSVMEPLVTALLADLTAGSEPHAAVVKALAASDPLAVQTGPALARLAKPEQLAMLLKRWLTDADLPVRKFGVMAAGRLQAAAAAVAGELLSQLADADADMRRAAWYALMRVDPDGRLIAAAIPAQFDGAAIKQLVLGLRDNDDSIRKHAAVCLGTPGIAAATAAPALLPLLQDENAAVQAAATKLLKNVSPAEIASAEANMYEQAMARAAKAFAASDSSTAARALDLCPPAKRDWAWNFFKRQTGGKSPVVMHVRSGYALQSIAFSSDGTRLTAVDENHEVFRYSTSSGTLENSYPAIDLAAAGTKPAPKSTAPKEKSDAALRAEELAYERREAAAMKAESAAAAKMDRLYAALDRAMNIADFRAQEAAINRAQRAIDLELEAQERAAAIADAKAEKAANAAELKAMRDRSGTSSGSRRPETASFVLAASPTGDRALLCFNSGSDEDVLRLYENAGGGGPKQTFNLKVRRSQNPQAKFSANGERMIQLQADSKDSHMQIAVFDTIRGTRLLIVRLPRVGPHLVSGSYTLYTVALSPDGKRLAVYVAAFVGTTRGEIRVWDVDKGDANSFVQLRDSDSNDNKNREIAFSRDGNRLASIVPGGKITVWDTASGEPSVHLTPQNVGPAGFDASCTLAFDPSVKLLAAASPTEPLRIFDLASEKEIVAFPLEAVPFASKRSGKRPCFIEFSPDGSRIAVALVGEIRVFSVGP